MSARESLARLRRVDTFHAYIRASGRATRLALLVQSGEATMAEWEAAQATAEVTAMAHADAL